MQEPPAVASETAKVIKASAVGLAGFAALYLVFFGLYLLFPYVRPGDNLVADIKHKTARHGNFFKSERGKRLHVMAFGYSKMLAGFKPDLFDAQMASNGFPSVESYNFGLPGDSRFVADLEAMAAQGTAPDIALLMFPWPAAPDQGPTFFHFLNNDHDLMEQLFPFRFLPRNLFILGVQAHGIARIPEIYEGDRKAVFQVVNDRGYFFISRQSHYANDELPPDFHMPGDRPNSQALRPVTLGPVYDQLAPILAKQKIQCLLVPSYYRQGEFAPAAPLNLNTVKVLQGQPNVQLTGPDYFLYPANLFSDPVHCNKPGAATYTRQLADLVTDWLRQQKMGNR